MFLLALGLVTTVPAVAAAAPRPPQSQDFCIVRRSIYTGNALDTLVFQDVDTLRPGRTIELKGMYFTPVRIPTPFHGSAVMTTDGTIRIGIYVHHSGRNQYDGNIYTSDKSFSGMTDATFAGTLNVDYNGDTLPDGVVTFLSEDCATITIP
jgi:hypothetical protein